MMEQMITPEKLTNRFCGNLGLANVGVSQASPPRWWRRFERCAIRRGTGQRNSASVAAAAIYLCVQLWPGEAGEGIDLRRISEVSGMAGGDHTRELRGYVPARDAHAPRGVQRKGGSAAGAEPQQGGEDALEAGLGDDAGGGVAAAANLTRGGWG